MPSSDIVRLPFRSMRRPKTGRTNMAIRLWMPMIIPMRLLLVWNCSKNRGKMKNSVMLMNRKK